MHHGGGVERSPDGGRDISLWESPKLFFQDPYRVVRHDVVAQRRAESQDVEEDIFYPISVCRRFVADSEDCGGPVECKGGVEDPTCKLLEAMHHLLVGGSACADRQDRVRRERGRQLWRMA